MNTDDESTNNLIEEAKTGAHAAVSWLSDKVVLLNDEVLPPSMRISSETISTMKTKMSAAAAEATSITTQKVADAVNDVSAVGEGISKYVADSTVALGYKSSASTVKLENEVLKNNINENFMKTMTSGEESLMILDSYRLKSADTCDNLIPELLKNLECVEKIFNDIDMYEAYILSCEKKLDAVEKHYEDIKRVFDEENPSTLTSIWNFVKLKSPLTENETCDDDAERLVPSPLKPEEFDIIQSTGRPHSTSHL